MQILYPSKFDSAVGPILLLIEASQIAQR